MRGYAVLMFRTVTQFYVFQFARFGRATFRTGPSRSWLPDVSHRDDNCVRHSTCARPCTIIREELSICTTCAIISRRGGRNQEIFAIAEPDGFFDTMASGKHNIPELVYTRATLRQHVCSWHFKGAPWMQENAGRADTVSDFCK